MVLKVLKPKYESAFLENLKKIFKNYYSNLMSILKAN
jgi:hypothetical protein